MLRSRYTVLGPDRMSKLLPGRSALSIRCKANRLGLKVGEVNDYVPLSFIADATGLSLNAIRDRAHRHKVIKKIQTRKGRPFKLLVPEAWADAYIRNVERATEADELRDHYYSLSKTAKIFGVHRDTIRNWLYGNFAYSYGAHAFNRIKVLTATGKNQRAYLFNPYDVEREAKLYREYVKSGNRRFIRPEQD